MRRRIIILIVLSLMWAITGCSALLPSPKIARIQVRGPANQSKEFVISLEDPLQQDTDIRISDRYAIKLDLQWLWYDYEDIARKEDLSNPLSQNLMPWFLCKYRF